jgi:Kef-type K+ transport system membrane component KefB
MGSLEYLALMWAGVFVSNIIAERTRMTSVVWFLVFGVVIVNLGVVPTESSEFISGLANLGIILIMFTLGFEENTSNFITSIKKSWGIAFFGAVAPFLAAYTSTYYFWGNANVSLMCGLTMTATAVSLTMVSLKSLGLGKSPAATRIMTSAVLDDVASLALVAILVPMAAGEGPADALHVLQIIGKAIAFFVIVLILGAWLFPSSGSGILKKVPLIRSYGIQHLLAFGRHSVLTVLLLALLVGILAHELGFHPAVGAYMAGLIFKEEYFLLVNTKGSYADTKRILENVAFSWIGPVFFIELGTKLVFDTSVLVTVLPYVAILTIGIFVSQVVSAALAARFTGGMDWPGSILIGFGMLGRAELAFVVINIAYIQNSILTTEAFYTLMLTAFILNILVPVTISLWKPYLK